MMQPILFEVKLFRNEADRGRSQTVLLKLMEALCQINEGHLAQKAYPPLFEAGVRYRREQGERWRDVPTLIERGEGDCEDLACWRIAELRASGVHAFPYVAFQRRNGAYRYHALVERFKRFDRKAGRFVGQTVEDPSRVLGMGWEAEYARQQRSA
ncbi:MAG TPA: hypothetical protein VGF45_03595 [Polyangia bacterium]